MINRRLVTNYLLKESRRSTEKIMERELKVSAVKNKAISIIGPRRAGKTYYLYKLRERFPNFLHADFENIAFKGIKAEEIYEVLGIYQEIFGKKPDVLFLDEVQKINGWSSLVRSLLDSEEYRIFITGSSSELLSKEIATQLRGRTLSYLLLPFSFREFLRAKGYEVKKYLTIDEEAKMKRGLKIFLEYGGYPEVVLRKEKERILREYYSTILYNDFVERFQLKNIELAKSIFEFCFQNFSKEFSVRRFVDFFKERGRAGKNTIYDYVGKLPETVSVFFLEKFSKSIYERKTWPKKIYVCDPGLSKVLEFSEDLGKKMENTVFLELLRSRNDNPLRTVYFLKLKERGEVDFVVKDGLKIRQLIQVTYAAGRDEVEPREIRSLLKAAELFKKDRPELSVITWDHEAEEEVKGKKVKFVPLWKWLLGR